MYFWIFPFFSCWSSCQFICLHWRLYKCVLLPSRAVLLPCCFVVIVGLGLGLGCRKSLRENWHFHGEFFYPKIWHAFPFVQALFCVFQEYFIVCKHFGHHTVNSKTVLCRTCSSQGTFVFWVSFFHFCCQNHLNLISPFWKFGREGEELRMEGVLALQLGCLWFEFGSIIPQFCDCEQVLPGKIEVFTLHNCKDRKRERV